MKWKSTVLASVIALFGLASTAGAVELAGTFGITGSVTVGAGTIDWFPTGTGTGEATVLPPTSGYFTDPGNGGPAIWVPFNDVEVDSLDISEVPTAGFTTAPSNTAINVANFLNNFDNTTNTEYDDLTFELTFIPLATGSVGSCTTDIAVGESCDLGPFLVTQATTNSLTISLSLNGIFRDPSLGLTSLLATGAYSTQGLLTASDGVTLIGTVSALLDELDSEGGSICSDVFRDLHRSIRDSGSRAYVAAAAGDRSAWRRLQGSPPVQLPPPRVRPGNLEGLKMAVPLGTAIFFWRESRP